jgi:HEAT repeat protein
MKAATDGHWTVRKSAVEALARMRDPQSLDALASLLQDPDHDVREAACRALSQFGDARAIESLVAILPDTQTSVRHAALSALHQIKPGWEKTEEARRAIPRLKSALKDREYWVRHAAKEALKLIQNAGSGLSESNPGLDERQNAALGALIAAAGFGHPDLRQAAAEALGRIGDARCSQYLTPLLVDSDKWVRESAAAALRKLGVQEGATPEWPADVFSRQPEAGPRQSAA